MADEATLRFVKLSEFATAPYRASPGAAGYDLYSAREKIIAPGGRACILTDLQLGIPFGCYGRIAPRSGLAVKNGVDVGAGVIDANFRGNVGVLIFNFGDEPFHVKIGDRVAQLVLERICNPDVQEVQSLDSTSRGGHGFGSTGSN